MIAELSMNVPWWAIVVIATLVVRETFAWIKNQRHEVAQQRQQRAQRRAALDGRVIPMFAKDLNKPDWWYDRDFHDDALIGGSE